MGMLRKLKGAADAARNVMAEANALQEQYIAEHGDPRLVDKPLKGAAGRASYGIEKPPEVPERIVDPVQWERVRDADRAARDATRTPYLAPDRSPLHFTRVTTRGETQARDVAEWLEDYGLTARPDLVFGLYRVPDRIRPSAGSEKGRVVEWDVVHAAPGPLEPSPPPADVFFEARTAWVARCPGEPSLVDEELALAYLLRAGIGPEQTLGIARHCTINPHTRDQESRMLAEVTGVHAFHAPGLGGTTAQELAAAAPFTLASGPPDGVRIEVLRWEPIARIVHPVRQRRPRLPSPFPQFPLTPQELLAAYLDIVGVKPQDSYGVQVTYHDPFDLMLRTSDARWITVHKTTGGDEMPCADGKPRVRMHGGQHIVITYRDTPGYAAGRERWQRYMAEVLDADLALGPPLRKPVPKPESKLARTVDIVGGVVDFFQGDPTAEDYFTPPRYCWPPTR